MVFLVLDGQGVTNEELIALAGPSRASGAASSRLTKVVADSARRWLSAADEEDGAS